MAKLSDLRQALAAAKDQLTDMQEKGDNQKKLTTSIFELGNLADDPVLFAEKESQIAELKSVCLRSESAKKAEIDSLTQQVERAETVLRSQAATARPIEEYNSDERTLSLVNGRARYAGLRSFKGQRADEDAFRVGQFIKASMYGDHAAHQWCKEHGVVMTRAQSEGVNSAGGVLVPEEMMNAIIVLRETFGVFRRECRVVPMGRDTLNWPRRTGGLTAYFVGENTALTESQAAFDNVNLTAKKLAVLTKLSTEIAEDAIIAIADYVVGEVGYAFASKEDDCGFNGDGTSTYGGMTGVTVKGIAAANAGSKYTAAAGHNTFALLDNTDVTGAIGKLPQYALPNAKFYVSQTGFATAFERLIATAGGNSISTLDGAISYRYLGFPIVISQKLPSATTSITGTTMMLFGDLSLAAAMGERRGVSIRRLDERFADADQIGIMGTERFDINVHDMGDATNAGPLIALVAP